MANKNSKMSSGYIIATLCLTIFCVFCGFAVNIVYGKSKNLYNSNLKAVKCLSDINNEISSVNQSMTFLVANLGVNGSKDASAQISSAFSHTKELIQDYKKIDGLSSKEKKRFDQLSIYVSSYSKSLENVVSTFESSGYEAAKTIYVQEILPIQSSVNEMLASSIEMGASNGAVNAKQAKSMFICIEITITILALTGIISILVSGNKAKNAVSTLEKRDEELTQATFRAEASQQAVQDIAFNNILTELPNRYLLESNLNEKLGRIQFDIALFDIDGFKNINDTYGYEIGDQCLASVALMLKQKYGKYADIYNINGDEFCLIFRGSDSSDKVQNIVEQIRRQLCEPLQNVGVISNNTSSACYCRCYQGWTISSAALLMKLESAIHSSKQQGGNCLVNVDAA